MGRGVPEGGLVELVELQIGVNVPDHLDPEGKVGIDRAVHEFEGGQLGERVVVGHVGKIEDDSADQLDLVGSAVRDEVEVEQTLLLEVLLLALVEDHLGGEGDGLVEVDNRVDGPLAADHGY